MGRKWFAFLNDSGAVVKIFTSKSACRDWVRSMNALDGYAVYGWAKEIA